MLIPAGGAAWPMGQVLSCPCHLTWPKLARSRCARATRPGPAMRARRCGSRLRVSAPDTRRPADTPEASNGSNAALRTRRNGCALLVVGHHGGQLPPESQTPTTSVTGEIHHNSALTVSPDSHAVRRSRRAPNPSPPTWWVALVSAPDVVGGLGAGATPASFGQLWSPDLPWAHCPTLPAPDPAEELDLAPTAS